MDPRLEEAFVASLYPLADGLPAPPIDSNQVQSRTKLEFLKAFYRTNLALEKLLKARKKHGPEGEKACREYVADLKEALLNRDNLEEEYRSQGIWVEPEHEGDFVSNLRFFFPPGSVGRGKYVFTTEIELPQS